MAVNFPTSPDDGDTITSGDSVYTYSSSKGYWLSKSTISGIQLDSLSVTTTSASGSGSVSYNNDTGGFTYVPPVIGAGSTVTVYATAADLPLSGNTAGAQAYVTATNRLYIWTGTGWYNIALINTSPSITTGSSASYTLATDGTATVITLVATDPEEVPIAWSYAVTTGSLGSTATVSQSGNVFTITPSAVEENAGTFSLTFTASDGVNTSTSTSAFTLSFSTGYDWSNFSSSDFSTVPGTYSNFSSGAPRGLVASDTHFAYLYTNPSSSNDLYISVHTLAGALVSNFKADNGTTDHGSPWQSTIRIDGTRVFLSRAGTSNVRVFNLNGGLVTTFSATNSIIGDTAPSGGYLICESHSGASLNTFEPNVFKLYNSSNSLVSTYTIPNSKYAEQVQVVGNSAYISVYGSVRDDLIILDLTNFSNITTYSNVSGAKSVTDGSVYISFPRGSNSAKTATVFDLSNGNALRTLYHPENPDSITAKDQCWHHRSFNIDGDYAFFQTYTNPISNIMGWEISTGNLERMFSVSNSGASDNGAAVSAGAYILNGNDGVKPKIAQMSEA